MDVLTLEHDEAVSRLRRLVAALPEERVVDAFIAGVGGSFRRGVQALASWSRVRHLPEHSYVPTSEQNRCCVVCALRRSNVIEPAKELAHIATGYASTSIFLFVRRFVVDLEDFAASAKVVPTEADRRVLSDVLSTAASMAPDAPPSRLEKEIASKRIVPKTDKSKRGGILQVLAAVGALPNLDRPPPYDAWASYAEEASASTARRRGRSDLEWPLSAWRGDLGVDSARAKRIFDIDIAR